jgi:hypothetical protein
MVEKAVKVDATTDIWDDPSIQFVTVPGIAGKEGALLVRREGSTTLVLNDLLANVSHPHGLGAHIMARLLGFGVSAPQVPYVGKWMFVKDKAAFASAFRNWADDSSLERIIVSHGDVLEDNPRRVLRDVADSLAR